MIDLTNLETAKAVIVADDVSMLVIRSAWKGGCGTFNITNTGHGPSRVREVILAEIGHSLPDSTRIYGEGFQKLSQTAGTLGMPIDLVKFTDRTHYRIPQPSDARIVVRSLLTLEVSKDDHVLLAFASCRRFSGEFRLYGGRIQIAMDCEGLVLEAGQTWELEQLVALRGKDREALLHRLAGLIAAKHPRLPFATVPTGWCSWYCYRDKVTAGDIRENLSAIRKHMPELRYIQIDDGYQPFMGDWLDPSEKFPNGLQGLCREIREAGFEPAVWVAPFIAQRESRLFREHPDWFVKGADGRPLDSSSVSFGGWRCGPWFCLDGTHPEAQDWLTQTFRTMRQQWGATYFKLDGIFWGAIHGGRFHDGRATRVEAYRRGMGAMIQGAGDAFIVGCNAPMWASLGLVHGMRISNDISRSWKAFQAIARETLYRNWQNGTLWINDPDCLELQNAADTTLSADEFAFHATAIYASGGMLLSGDNLTLYTPQQWVMLGKMFPPTGVPARFDDTSFRVGRMQLTDRLMIVVLNWTDGPQSLSIAVEGKYRVREVWSAKEYPPINGVLSVIEMPPRSGRLYELRRA